MFTVHRDNRVFPRMDGVWVCTDGFSLWLSLAASIHQWLMIITGYWTHLCSWTHSVVRSTNAVHLFILSTLWSAPAGQVSHTANTMQLPRPSNACKHTSLTVFLKESLSSRVSVSALAMTGTMLTTLLRCLINSTSRGLRLEDEKDNKIQL